MAELQPLEQSMFWGVIVVAFISLAYAYWLWRDTLRREKGSPEMQKVWNAIKTGANAYLQRQLRTMLPILLLLGPAERHLRRFRFMDRFFDWLFKRTVSRSEVIKKYESLGLILFVAIPAPMTGAWTGAIAAYLFKLPLRMAVPCIILGILIAGLVVTLVSQGVISLWH